MKQRAFIYAATQIACWSVLYSSYENHVSVHQRRRRRYRRRYELEMTRGYADWSINNMKLGDGVRFFGFFRMTWMEFEYLLNLVAPTIQMQTTRFDEPISPQVMLAVTLRYLFTGEKQSSLSYTMFSCYSYL